MIASLRRLFHRPGIQLGSLGRAGYAGPRLRNERFATYLAGNNRRSINTDRKDAMLAGRRLFRGMFSLALIALVIWIVVESASAIGVF